MRSPETIAIIGAGLAGTRAACALRKEGFDGAITVIGEESVRPYDRVTLSKHYLYGRPGFHGLYLHDESFYADRGIELVLGATVELLDVGRGDVKLTSGRRVRYDELLLATGSDPNHWHGRGSDLAGVHYLRTLADADALRASFAAAAARGGPVVVVGAGWAGCEIAAAASEYGLPVDLISRSDVPLERQLGREMGEFFRYVHLAHGVEVHTRAEITALGGSGRVEGVVLADGSVLPADVVVFAIGASPRTELAEAAGIAVAPGGRDRDLGGRQAGGRGGWRRAKKPADSGFPQHGPAIDSDGNGGILVDEFFRTSVPHVYAAGDVASVRNMAARQPGRHSRLEHYSAAFHQGPAVARSMLGIGSPYSQIPFFFSDQYDVWMEYTGEHWPGDDVVVRRLPGDLPGTDAFIAFWLDHGRVTAGMNINIRGVPEEIRQIIMAGLTLDPAAVADPAVPLMQLR